ncbi:amino acid permease family protein, partial [Vibrio parahaemolyticus V-223/04]
RNRSRFT